jgi:hypothetical protein
MALEQLACSGVESVGNLNRGDWVASVGVAPLQCGTSLGFVSIQGWTVWGGRFAALANRPNTIKRCSSVTWGEAAANEVRSLTLTICNRGSPGITMWAEPP